MGKLVLIIACGWFVGCTAIGMESLFVGEDEGRFLISADRAGLDAFGKAMNGLVVTGKAKKNQPDAYFSHMDKVVTFRAFKPLEQNDEGAK